MTVSRSRLHTVFRVSVLLKGLDGVLEIVGGLVLLFVAPHSIYEVTRWLVAHDLAGNRHDFVARHLLHSASDLTTSTTLFGAVYLLVHGGAKLVLVVLVLRDKLWAYPWMIGLLLAFIVYQIYRLALHLSLGLLALTLFDIFIVGLTVLEYRKQRARVAKG